MPHDPVVLGGERATTVETRAAIVTEVWFPAQASLQAHTHERTVFGVMLEGSFSSLIAGRRLDCRPDSAWTEPAGEPHANVIGREGARVVAIQPNPEYAEMTRSFGPLLGSIHEIAFAARADAARLARELRHVTPAAELTIDALVLLLLAGAARSTFEKAHHARPPAWLFRVREALRADFPRPPSIAVLAAMAQVSPSHLAHAFRRFYGVTPGDYVREVRADWAARQLVETDRPVSAIALDAGYADQSHLTRELRRRLGVTPHAHRSANRGGSRGER